MSEMDDRLQQHLQALENGQSVDEVLRTIPKNAEEIIPLVHLATAMRMMPHPEPQTEQDAGRQHILAAAGLAPQTTRQPLARKPTDNRLRTNVPNWGWLRWSLTSALVASLGLFLCVLFAFLAFQIWLSAPYGAQSATVIHVVGQVEAASDETGKAMDWRPLADGNQVKSGMQIRTGISSSTTLVFFDGSRTILGPSTHLTLLHLDGKRGNVLQVSLAQLSGVTTHSVIPLRGKDSFFVVGTPAGTANVHGTHFEVHVASNGQARFAVFSGEVQVSNAGAEFSLTEGQATTASPGQAPESPAYTFSVQGLIETIQGQNWRVSGLPFRFTNQSEAFPQVGKRVHIEGRIRQDGTWVVDRLEPLDTSVADEPQQGSFNGILQAIQGDTWQVSGTQIRLAKNAEISQGLAPGRAVRVIFTFRQAEDFVATQISPLDSSTSLPTSDPSAKPSLSFEPDELEMAGCLDANSQPVFVFLGHLANTAEKEKDYAADVVLGYTLIRGMEYVDRVIIDPVSWPRIEAAQNMPFTIQVILKPEWTALPAGNEIKLRVFVAHELNRPGHHRGRLTLTIVSTCGNPSTPTQTIAPSITTTPTFTLTPSITISATTTSTPTITPSITTTPTAGFTDCTGAKPHPQGMRLAQHYGVPYEEIMGWFCQGFGFGEIDLAYGLSRETGVAVTDIFEMRKSGMGWGEIKKRLAQGTPKAKPTKKP